jgi:hypothetical protein
MHINLCLLSLKCRDQNLKVKIIQPLVQDDWTNNNTVTQVQRPKSLHKTLLVVTGAQHGLIWQNNTRPTYRQFHPALVASTYVLFECYYRVSDSVFKLLYGLAKKWLNYTYVGGGIYGCVDWIQMLTTGSYKHDKTSLGSIKVYKFSDSHLSK